LFIDSVDVAVVWEWLTILPYILKKHIQHIFTTVTGSPAITGIYWMITDR